MTTEDRSVPSGVRLRPLTPEDAAAVSKWRYGGPWSVYDGSEEDLISADKGYQAIVDEQGTFIGYLCTGQEARVPGLEGAVGVVDVGVGLDPAVVGKGRGASTLLPLLDVVAAGATDATSLRALVQSWNLRSLRVCARLGFFEAGRHVVHEPDGDVEYVIVVRPLDPPASNT